MAKKLEIKQKFGKWTIIEEIAPKIISNKPRRMFRCKCECGNIGEVQLACLRNEHSTSCGCKASAAKHLNIPYNIIRYRLSNCKWNIKQLINYCNDRN